MKRDYDCRARSLGRASSGASSKHAALFVETYLHRWWLHVTTAEPTANFVLVKANRVFHRQTVQFLCCGIYLLARDEKGGACCSGSTTL